MAYLSAENVRLLIFFREEVKTFVKIFLLKVFIDLQVDLGKKKFPRSPAVDSKSTAYSIRLGVIRYFKSSSLFPVGIYIFCFKQPF